MKKLAVILISMVTAFTGVAPAQAFPSVSVPKFEATKIQEVGHRGHGWRGHRGYRQRHYGHRRYRHHRGNAGAIIGGLAAGAIIGGAIAAQQQPRYYRGGNAHVNWCHSRYRSYRAYDNTFQPYHGPRRQCRSPY